MLDQLHRSGLEFGKHRRQNPTAVICTSTVMSYTGPEHTGTVGGTCLKVTKLIGTATYNVGDNLKYAVAIDQNILKPNTRKKMAVD